MPRYVGSVGIRGETIETEPGIFLSEIREVTIRGELINHGLRWSSNEVSQDSASLNATISVVYSTKLLELLTSAVYVTWIGKKWLVTSLDYKHPRINLSLGRVYNGPS